MKTNNKDSYGEGFDDGYGELLNLARDARATRKRTSYWTTGLIVSGMAASGAYVTTVNQQMDELSDVAATATAEARRLDIEVGRLQGEREILISTRDVYKQNAAWFATMAPALKERPLELVNGETPVTVVDRPPPQFALSNMVWYVDGSRRFPMAANDILWIPEGRFWVRLESPGIAGVAPTRITVHEGAEPPASTDGAQPREPGEYPEGAIDLSNSNTYYEKSVTRGNANCVVIERADRTDRPQFGSNYVDMVITFRNAAIVNAETDPETTDCRNGVRTR